MSPVRRHLTSTARGIVGGADGLEQMLVGAHAERLAERAIAVIEIEPVGAGTQMCCDGDLNRFVPRARDLEEDLVLALEQDLLIVGATCRIHRAVQRNQLLSTKRRTTLPRSSSLRSGCHASVRWGPAANLPGGPVVGHPCASARFRRGRYLGGRPAAPLLVARIAIPTPDPAVERPCAATSRAAAPAYDGRVAVSRAGLVPPCAVSAPAATRVHRLAAAHRIWR